VLIGDRLSEETLLTFVAEDAARISMKNIRKVLVSGGYYSIHELDDPYELGGLFKYDLIVRAIREKGSRNLLSALHEVREFSDETVEALRAEGINLDNQDESTDQGDPQLPKSMARRMEVSIATKRKLRRASERISRVREDYAGLIWLVGIVVGLPTVAYVILQIAFSLTATENIPDLWSHLRGTRTPTPIPILRATVTNLPTETSTLTEIPTESPTLVSTSPGATSGPTDQASEELPSMAISEIMFVPQPPYEDKSLEGWNEYVELFNYGDEPFDVSEMWISDGGVIGNPDMLVSWGERLPNIRVGKAIIDSTVVPPGSYALILSKKYDEGDRPYDDVVTSETIILTLADDPDSESELIGKDGLSATGEFLDVLVLYVGSRDSIERVVSTYGSPQWDKDGSASSIQDDGLDLIPRAITSGWGGYRRGIPDGADTLSNWMRFTWSNMSPGY